MVQKHRIECHAFGSFWAPLTAEFPKAFYRPRQLVESPVLPTLVSRMTALGFPCSSFREIEAVLSAFNCSRARSAYAPAMSRITACTRAHNHARSDRRGTCIESAGKGRTSGCIHMASNRLLGRLLTGIRHNISLRHDYQACQRAICPLALRRRLSLNASTTAQSSPRAGEREPSPSRGCPRTPSAPIGAVRCQAPRRPLSPDFYIGSIC